MTQIHHAYAQINGIRMHYARAGSGPPLLLLHGFPEFWYSWRHQIAALAPFFTVIAPDLRGYNETERPSWGYELDVLVADVVELLRTLGYERVRLAGHDWGGALAWATAIAYPQRIERLVVLNAPHPAIFATQLRHNPRQARRSWYMGFFTLPWLPELALSAGDYAAIARALRGPGGRAVFSAADIEAYKDAISKPGALGAALAWYRSAARRRASGLLSGTGLRVPMPTLLIWGDQDRYLGAELVAGTERFVPDLRVEWVHGVGHWVQQEAPDHVSRAMLEFLR